MLIAGGLLMMIPFFWMVAHLAQDAGRGVRGAAAVASRRVPTGRTTSGCGTRSRASRSATFFLNSLKIATAQHDRRSSSRARWRPSRSRSIPFRGRGPLFGLLLATLIIPFQVVLVPNFILWRTLPNPFSDSGNFIGTQEPLWVGAFLGGAFGIFLLRQFFLAVPSELADAARVDGANPWQIFRHGSTCRWRSPRARHARDLHLHVDAGTTCSTR